MPPKDRQTVAEKLREDVTASYHANAQADVREAALILTKLPPYRPEDLWTLRATVQSLNAYLAELER